MRIVIEMLVARLDDAVDELWAKRKHGADLAGDLRRHAGSIEGMGGSGDVARELQAAARILEEQADLIDRLRWDLARRVDIARTELHATGRSAIGIILGVAGAFRGMLGGGGRGAGGVGRVDAPGASSKGKVAAGGARSSGSLMAAWTKRPTGELRVPFATQFGSSYANREAALRGGAMPPPGDLNTANGGGNCGPSSLAMVIDYWIALGGTTPGMPPLSALEAANIVRGGADRNYSGFNDHTNFGIEYKDSPDPILKATGQASEDLLTSYGLTLTPITSLEDLKSQLEAGHPVVLLVDNTAYKDLDPYGTHDGSGYFTAQEHIIVVTGIIGANVYVNDPLAKAPLQVPIDPYFRNAGESHGWFGASVAPR